MTVRILVATAASLLALGVPAPASAAPAYPAAQGRCVDRTGVLGDDLCARITAILRVDEKATSDEIAVAVVPTTGDQSIEKWSTGLFNRWGVGKAARNNGVLLVVAVDDHKVRLETGRGMAGRLDDTAAAQIVDTVITPHFAVDEYALGVLDGLDAVRREIGHEVTAGTELAGLAGSDPEPDSVTDGYAPGPDDESTGVTGDEGASWGGFALIALMVVGIGGVGFVLSRAGGGGSRVQDGHWSSTAHHFSAGSTTNSSSGFSSGSGSDFGGGSSSGGGASGSW